MASPRNIMWNDNVLVREDEYGIFFRDGKALVVFDRPDRYALTTETEIYGLKIMKFAGLNINMPEEVQKAINKCGAMSALGVNYNPVSVR